MTPLRENQRLALDPSAILRLPMAISRLTGDQPSLRVRPKSRKLLQVLRTRDCPEARPSQLLYYHYSIIETRSLSSSSSSIITRDNLVGVEAKPGPDPLLDHDYDFPPTDEYSYDAHSSFDPEDFPEYPDEPSEGEPTDEQVVSPFGSSDGDSIFCTSCQLASDGDGLYCPYCHELL